MSVPARDPARPSTHEAPRAYIDHQPRRVVHRSPDLRLPGSPQGAPVLEPTPRRKGPRRGGRGPHGVTPRPGNIPGLDGLRAIAVVAVLLFHFLPATLPGGFLGVDVFFVVSGFLITTLLLREIDSHGRVDLLNFWRRRARRLLPALVLVVVTSVSVARLVGGDLLVGIGRQTLGALTFTSNWLEVAAGASYFHSTSPILFVNFWSLAVEEQFYLFWPLALVVALALTRTTRQRVWAVAGLALASTVLMALLYTPGEDATRVYYGTDTHLMGVMAGAAFALAWADPQLRAGLRTALWRRWRGVAVLAALVILLALMRWTTFTSTFTFRGGIALATVATLVLIAGLLEAPSPWRKMMSSRPLVWVGERSYGIYLWHWPVLVIAGALVPYTDGTTRGYAVLLAALLATLVLAELSLRLVERPVRRHGMRASVRALIAWVTTPWQVSRVPRLVAAGLALLLIGTAVAIATAPEKSATQRQIEETESRLTDGGVLGAAAVANSTDSAGLGAELGMGEEAEGAGGEAPGEGAPADAAAADADTDADADASGDDLTEDTAGEAADEDASAEPEDSQEGEPAGEVASVNGLPFTADEDGLLVPAGSQLTAIGDSLVVTSADGLAHRFDGINFLAQSNRQWGQAEEVLTAALAQDAIRDNVVLHLGTNAGVDEAGLRAALDTLGPERNVVVMNLYVQATFTESSNRIIDDVVADYPHAVVGRWSQTIGQRPQDLQADRVHPDIAGMHVYAEVVARGFDELARRST
ncbi:acyltransferase family protein [Ornithinimicrobium pratense]|uniref:Acyltransferase n=1 Tax=Ornithinimicrobium pratense TaxID=2593973 RepID=A0A5J6V2I8_9MICO|nr:acyltransferase family protein [Ornithinimicrobium pratense]QFG67361.1 acyltransferase [Ornithinimicrobium pratense]